MFENIKLSRLPGYGKLFVALFTVLVILVVLWMVLLGAMESGIIGEPVQRFDYEAAEEALDQEIEAIMADEQAVTAPNWTDSGQQEPITPEDEEIFEEYAEEELPFWELFREKVGEGLEHISSQALIFFALGLLFLFTGYSIGIKKFFYWLLAILIALYAIGTSGHGFCWPADFLFYSACPLILIILFIMAIMVLKDLGRKA